MYQKCLLTQLLVSHLAEREADFAVHDFRCVFLRVSKPLIDRMIFPCVSLRVVNRRRASPIAL